VAPWNGALALTMVVRDEEEILAENLDYHLSQGVDVILVVDHGSTDGTSAILSEYERLGCVRWFRDEARPHVQAERVNRLLKMAADEYHADWVIHCDADEFWMPAAGSLRDVFAAIPDRYGYLRVKRHNYLPAPDAHEPFHQRMLVRHRCSLNLRGTPLEPKVAQRPAAGASVAPGNHDLESPMMDQAPDFGAVEVLHFQMRTFEQFERKVLRNGIGHERNTERVDGIGCDQLELLETYRRGELHAYYEAQALTPALVKRGLELGELVVDRRLQRHLSSPLACTQESPQVQAVLSCCWESSGRMADAYQQAEERTRSQQALIERAAAEHEATVARLEGELQQARHEAAECQRILDVMRNSRVMRYTAPARRAYYNIRRTG
jgi:Glycosyl transferase family 2